MRSKQCELSLSLQIDWTKLITWLKIFESSTSLGFSIKGSEKKIVLSWDMKNNFLLIYPTLYLGQFKIVLYIAWTILQIWFIYTREKSKGMQLLSINDKGFPFSLYVQTSIESGIPYKYTSACFFNKESTKSGFNDTCCLTCRTYDYSAVSKIS